MPDNQTLDRELPESLAKLISRIEQRMPETGALLHAMAKAELNQAVQKAVKAERVRIMKNYLTSKELFEAAVYKLEMNETTN